MSAQLDLAAEVLRPMTVDSLDGVMVLETEVYPFPWTRGNFVDSLASGYTAWTLERASGELIGYCVALAGAGEMHLLNITVVPESRRCGHARRMLDELAQVCHETRAERLWLEVRESNGHARAAYLRLGFREVGLRKDYYPAPASRREHAVVMTLDIATNDVRNALD
ncbi:MAG: ribosomal protein S18-alanine N-acetyltransferase [Caldimonas sp.]